MFSWIIVLDFTLFYPQEIVYSEYERGNPEGLLGRSTTLYAVLS